jgi:hypothetical protein
MSHVFIKMKNGLLLFSLMGFASLSFAKSGTSDGGGGGDAHSRFIKTGIEIADYFVTTDQGKKVAKDFKLDINAFESVFTPANIKAILGPLQDRLGNTVDARVIEENGTKHIEIDKSRFQDFFDRNIDVHHLVAKEAFRFLGYGESSLAMSLKLIPFKSGPTLCDPQLAAQLGKRAIERAQDVASIADNGGSWKPWEKALCLNQGYLQESMYISMDQVMKCVQNEPKLYQEAARIFNLGGDVGKKCWENLSRDDVRTYFNDIGFQIKNLLGAAGLSK